MCYNFATFVLYLDVITLIYRENRLTSSETCLSAINIDYQWFAKITPDFTPDNVKSGVFSIILLFRLKLKSNKGILKGKGHKLLS